MKRKYIIPESKQVTLRLNSPLLLDENADVMGDSKGADAGDSDSKLAPSFETNDENSEDFSSTWDN